MDSKIMGIHKEMLRKRIFFSRNFCRTQAVVWGLFFFAISASSALTPARPQAAAPAPTAAAPATQANQDFPDNPGKDVFLRICSQCHSPANVRAKDLDRDGWADLITKMNGYGATGTDEEFSAILDYLTQSFPPLASKINVNKSTAAELQTGLALTAIEAGGIVDYRQKNGDFKTIDDLKKVPGIDPAKLDAKKNLLAF
jgi:competence protein ComEA